MKGMITYTYAIDQLKHVTL